MITEGKKREKKRQGCVSKAAVPPCRARVGWTWSTALGTGHLITAGKLEESGTAASVMKGLRGLAWGERLKDWNMYRLGKWRGSPPPHAAALRAGGGGSSFQQAQETPLQRNVVIRSRRETQVQAQELLVLALEQQRVLEQPPRRSCSRPFHRDV